MPRDWPAIMQAASRESRCVAWPLFPGFVRIQIEEPPDHLMDGSSLGVVGGRFERGDGRVQQLVDDAAGHRVNGRFLLRRDGPQLAPDAVNLRLPDGLAI